MEVLKKLKKKVRHWILLLPHNIAFNLYKLLFRRSFKKLQNKRSKAIEYNSSSYKQFDNLKCVFIHIPKNAGVSLNRAVFGNLGGGHQRIIDYHLVYSKQELDSYFKFAFVRNPWDRLVSAYFFLKEGGMNWKDKMFYEKELRKFVDFNEFVCHWVNKKNIHRWIHFVPQYKFVCFHNKIAVDKIYKVEEINDAIFDIKQKLNIDFKLEQNNKTKGKDKNYRMYYNKQTREKVYSVYYKDIIMFNYKF